MTRVTSQESCFNVRPLSFRRIWRRVEIRIKPSEHCSQAIIVILVFSLSFAMMALCEKCVFGNETEFRAVAVQPFEEFSGDPKQGKGEIEQFTKRISDSNINAILAWVPSDYLPALTDQFYQTRFPIAKWDCIGELIKASYEKGIQVHIWYSFTYYKSPRSPEFNPHYGGNSEWAARQLDELLPDPLSGKIAPRRMRNVCPLYPAARRWELNYIADLARRYPLAAGIHIEEPGYTGRGICVCDLCMKVFSILYGKDLPNNIEGEEAQDLRCIGTTEFMRHLHTCTVALGLPLSTNGGWLWEKDRSIGRDWLRWSQMGWLRFYIAQIYTSDMHTFETRTSQVIRELSGHCPLVVSIAIEWGGGKNNNTVETLVKQIEAARSLGAKGVVFFPGRALTDEILDTLKKGPFSNKVLPF